MSITNIRFRNDGDLIVLQVCEYKTSTYSYDKQEWRDAKTEDLLDVANVIRNSSMTYLPSSNPD